MKNKNICKFISEPIFDSLDTYAFIFETDLSVMKTLNTLNCHRMILVKSGSVIFNINDLKIQAETGSVVFIFENESFFCTPQKETEYMYIDFSGTRANTLFKRFGINSSNRHFQGFEGLVPLWHDSLSRAIEENIDISSESILLYTISRFKAVTSQNDFIQEIIDITEDNFSDSSLSLSKIAKMLSYNEKYVSHAFKNKMGIGYSEYLTTTRIKYAVMLFEHGSESISNVAFLSGFKDPLYFSKVFKKLIGVSPTDYKKTVKQK